MKLIFVEESNVCASYLSGGFHAVRTANSEVLFKLLSKSELNMEIHRLNAMTNTKFKEGKYFAAISAFIAVVGLACMLAGWLQIRGLDGPDVLVIGLLCLFLSAVVSQVGRCMASRTRSDLVNVIVKRVLELNSKYEARHIRFIVDFKPVGESEVFSAVKSRSSLWSRRTAVLSVVIIAVDNDSSGDNSQAGMVRIAMPPLTRNFSNAVKSSTTFAPAADSQTSLSSQYSSASAAVAPVMNCSIPKPLPIQSLNRQQSFRHAMRPAKLYCAHCGTLTPSPTDLVAPGSILLCYGCNRALQLPSTLVRYEASEC